MKMHPESLQTCVERNLEIYFNELEGQSPTHLWDMIMHNVEKSMLAVVMNKCEGNQSKASEILGLSRTTLRKKLVNYQLLK